MNSLAKYLVEEIKGKTIAIFGGGFKPPTKGHFSVVKQALEQNPEIAEFRVLVGAKERDGITQSQSVLIWEIYAKYLPFKVDIIPSKVAPIKAIYDAAKENPQHEILWVIGARDGNEEDFSDIAKRTTSINKYPNLELRTIVSKDGISGTAARNALNQTPEKFTSFLPDELSDEEKQEIVSILSPSPINEEYILKNLEKEFPIELQLYDKGTHLELDKILVKYKKEGIGTKVMKKIIDYANRSEQPIYLTPSTSYGGSSVSRLEKFYKKLGFEPNKDKNISNLKMVKYPLNEGAESINYKQKIVELTKHMLDQGKNIKPLPKVVFKNDEAEAEDFFGKTALYQPQTQTIVLYVKDRHPKDIVRSFSHEMIHHIQNLEGRLGKVTTTDTNEDDDLDKIEREAYLDGNMTFRNWTDTFVGDQMLRENYDDYKKFGKDIVIQAYDYFDQAYPIDKNKINLQDSIHFISKWSDISRNKQRIRNVIFKQLMEAYRGTALESFNKKHKFTPNFGGFQRADWEAAHAYFSFSPYFYKYETDGGEQTIKGFFSTQVTYATGEEAYNVENDFISQAANNIGPILDPNFKEKPTGDNNNPELGAILEVAPVTFIPFIEAPAESDVKNDELTSSHQSKKLWRDIFNDIGLQCISLEKDPEWELDDHQLGEKKDPFGLTAYARELALLREDEGEYKVYLDMDGVVADFERRFTELAGMAPKEFENKYGKNAFWDFIDEGDNKIKFWVGIPPMPGAKELVSHIASNFDYEMLTAPSLKKQSLIGKTRWIKKWSKEGLFPSQPKINFKRAKNKHKIKSELSQFDILIDDKQSTIDNWNNAGGTGILYQSAEQVIKDLQNVKKGI